AGKSSAPAVVIHRQHFMASFQLRITHGGHLRTFPEFQRKKRRPLLSEKRPSRWMNHTGAGPSFQVVKLTTRGLTRRSKSRQVILMISVCEPALNAISYSSVRLGAT